jgi:hypothetical protein
MNVSEVLRDVLQMNRFFEEIRAKCSVLPLQSLPDRKQVGQ